MPASRMLRDSMQKNKPITLPWWGVLSWMAVCGLLVWSFDRIGRSDLARPTLYSVGMIGVAIALKWQLRRHAWFWIAMAIIAAIHAVLIASVHWTTNWVPAILIIPVGLADLFIILTILSAVGRFLAANESA